MKKHVGLVILFSCLINTCSVSASNEIALKSRRFTPAKGITAAAKARIEAVPGRVHVLIQLERIPTIKEKKELEAKGIRLLSYIPNKASFASIDSDKTGEIAALSNVRAIIEISHEDKISSHILAGEFFWERVKDGRADFIVEFFKDVSLIEAERVIAKHKGYVIGRVASLNAIVVTVRIEQSIDLALEDSVKWVEQELPLEGLNDGTRDAIDVDTVQGPLYNLDGTGIDVLVYDVGLVDNTHDDFGDRVTLGEDGFTDAHATHVAGTVGGDGSRSEAEGGTPLQWRGMAPGVDIISYYVSGLCLWGGPDNRCLYDDSGQMADMYDNFNEGITTYGPEIGTASVGAQPCHWGINCDFEGDYSPFARLIDTIIYDRSIPITWAAANERNPEFPCFRGCGEYNTISPTSTGKNAIIVGATNSNDDSMTTFSSWGPTDDGRIKPDVVAPGCQVGGDWGITSTMPVDTYESHCGTSMATPAVAGSVALMLEDWRDVHSDEPDPLPSTIKAILIQTANDLGNLGPDYSYGYGLIKVKDAIDLIRQDTSDNVILEDSIFEQGDIDTFTVDVPEEQSELKITVVWDDYPGNPAAEQALVNDIDLIVNEPDQTRHYPWTLDPENPGNPAERNEEEDHLNNVEQVLVDNPVSGTWTIQISGTTIPEPAQLYSLISNIVFGPTPPRAYDGSAMTEINTQVVIALEATDDGVPDPPGELDYIITSLPSHGTLSDDESGQISSVPYTLVSNGNHVIYTPDTDYTGPDSFKFKANDDGSSPNGGDSDEATISIQVFEIVHWWKLDEEEGTTADDSGAGGKDGTLTNFPGDDSQWVTGKIDGGLDFDGENDYVSFSVPSAIDALKGDTVTISAWIKRGVTVRTYLPVLTQYYFEEGVHYGYYLCLENVSGEYLPTFYLDDKSAQSSEDIDDVDWHHIVGLYDNKKLSIYVDGVFKDSKYYDDESGADTAANIGYDGEGNYFKGIIDDVRVYNWGVDVDEILDKMYYGTSKFSILDEWGVRMAWFDSLGNLFLKGTLTEGGGVNRPAATADDEFVIQDATGNLAVINATNGNISIYGSEQVDWEDPGQADEFIVKDEEGNPVSYIDESGNLYLKGELYQNPEP